MEFPNVVSSYKRVMAISCNHGNRANRNAISAAILFREAFKPDEVIHLGDNYDLSSLRTGALSNKDGRVGIECAISGDDFTLTWRETGGPAVVPPERKSFGSRVIAMGLGGKVDTDYKPEGIVVRLHARVSDLRAV